jgi:hypothetical protein
MEAVARVLQEMDVHNFVIFGSIVVAMILVSILVKRGE